MKRKISAILAADVVKYSTLVAGDEEDTVRRLAAYRAVFQEATPRHGGRVVNMVGDAVLAEFPSSVDAVRCALDVQAATQQGNQAYPPERWMQIRIGITLADIMDDNGELFGDGVNIAARLESLAPPGGICLSQTVREQVSGKVPSAFEDIGPQRVKNLPAPIHAYVISPDGAARGTASRRATGWKRRRVVATGAVIAVACAATIVAATQLHQSGLESGAIAGAPQLASVTPGSGGLRFDGAKLRALATRQEIPLPRNVKVLLPAASVPARLVGYLGAWGGDKRWNDKGRQAILVIESIDEDGTALGVYAQGVPLVTNAVTQNSARFVPFAAMITEKGLRFPWAQSNYAFTLMPDGTMWGQLDSNNERGHFNLTITLDHIE